jgi:hypothetical protein
MNKLQTLRENYNNFNKLHFNERIAKSKPIEKWIQDTMNFHGVSWLGKKITNWKQCNLKDDKTNKRDLQAEYDGKIVYSQNKFRQPNSGSDIGQALVQPYPGSKDLLRTLLTKDTKWIYDNVLARDYKFDGIIYSVLDNPWENLMIVPLELAKKTYTTIFKEWLRSDIDLNYNNRIFKSKEIPGGELRWKKDNGKGYDSGLEKILCYFPISTFDKSQIEIIPMIEPVFVEKTI